MKKLLLVFLIVAFTFSMAQAERYPWQGASRHNFQIIPDSMPAVANSVAADTSDIYSIGYAEQVTAVLRTVFGTGSSTKVQIVANVSMDQVTWIRIDSLIGTAAATGSDSVKADFKDFSTKVKVYPYVEFIREELVAAAQTGWTSIRYFIKE